MLELLIMELDDGIVEGSSENELKENEENIELEVGCHVVDTIELGMFVEAKLIEKDSLSPSSSWFSSAGSPSSLSSSPSAASPSKSGDAASAADRPNMTRPTPAAVTNTGTTVAEEAPGLVVVMLVLVDHKEF